MLLIPRKDLIEDRLRELRSLHLIRMQKIRAPYQKLSELEKIPLRVYQAEILAFEELLKGCDLELDMKNLAANERYCGAAGFKKAIEWINEL